MQQQKSCCSNQNQQKLQPGFSRVNGQLTFDWGNVTSPQGIRVSQNQCGYCLLATRDYKKGQKIFQTIYKSVPIQLINYKFTLDGVQYNCNQINSVIYYDERSIFTHCGFLNHRCQANTKTFQESLQKEYIMATKDIKQGEQIFSNYFYYVYEDYDFQCKCTAPDCYGRIRGFRFLPLQEKLKHLPNVHSYLKWIWFQKDKTVFNGEETVPKNLEIREKAGHNQVYEVICKQAIKKGETVFRVKGNQLAQGVIVIFKVGDKYTKLDPTQKKIQRKNFCLIQNLIKEDENSNCQITVQQGQIVCKSLKDIAANEQITIVQNKHK